MIVHSSKRCGFTLVEMMVAMLIGAIAVSQIMGLFVSQLQVFQAHRRTVNAQQDARLVSDLLLQNIRMAGFMMPSIAAISSIDGGNTSADILCVSDSTLLDDTRVDEAMGTFDRAGITADVVAIDSDVDLVPSQMDIDLDGDNDFTVGAGIIISDGDKTHCARVTGIVAGVVDFEPATPAGFLVDASGGRAVPALIYELTSSGLQRNGLLLSPEVEDLQIEYAVDANNDGMIGVGEFPIHDLNASVPSRVLGLRLSVMTRSSREDPNFTGPGRGALANRAAAGASDKFQRRVVSVNAALRNLL